MNLKSQHQDNAPESLESNAWAIPIPTRGIRRFVIALGVLAASLASYLLYVFFVGEGRPLGCGENQGCAEVLSSRWSNVLGIPVSLVALATYLLLIAVMLLFPRDHAVTRRMAWQLMLMCASVMTGAAVWFIGLQLFVVQAFCGWCTAMHCLGLVIAACCGVATWRARKGQAKLTGWSLPRVASQSVALSLLLLAGLIATQIFFGKDPGGAARGKLYVDDLDVTQQDQRRIVMMRGALDFVATEVPIVGPANAEFLVVMLYDYCCPHCRVAHGWLRKIQQESDQAFSLVMLPVPLGAECNVYRERTPARFEESCELARLAMAIYRVAPGKFSEFDRWMFENSQPRKLEAALVYAQTLSGREDLQQVMKSDRWIENRIRLNVEAFQVCEQDLLPILLSPGMAAVVGRPGSLDELAGILERELGITTSTGGSGNDQEGN